MYKNIDKLQILIQEVTKINKLWVSVLGQSLADCFADNVCGENYHFQKNIKNKSIKWLLDANKDLELICDLANLNFKKTKNNISNYLGLLYDQKYHNYRI